MVLKNRFHSITLYNTYMSSTLKRWHFPTPYTECVCTDRMSVNGEEGVFSSKRELNK